MGEHAAGEGPVLSRSRLVRLRQEEADLRARVQPLLDEHGLLPEHWRILAVVDDHPGITMTSLASRGADLAARLLAAEEGSDVGTTSAGLADVTGRA